MKRYLREKRERYLRDIREIWERHERDKREVWKIHKRDIIDSWERYDIWVKRHEHSNKNFIHQLSKKLYKTNSKITIYCRRVFELSNPREYFYNIWNIHLVLPSTPTLMVALVLQLLQLQQLDGEQCLPPYHFS